jgi:hypothetical protein
MTRRTVHQWCTRCRENRRADRHVRPMWPTRETVHKGRAATGRRIATRPDEAEGPPSLQVLWATGQPLRLPFEDLESLGAQGLSDRKGDALGGSLIESAGPVAASKDPLRHCRSHLLGQCADSKPVAAVDPTRRPERGPVRGGAG